MVDGKGDGRHSMPLTLPLTLQLIAKSEILTAFHYVSGRGVTDDDDAYDEDDQYEDEDDDEGNHDDGGDDDGGVHGF